MKTLDQLGRGQIARVVDLRGEGDNVGRLYAMGLLPGKIVRHRNTAPLGDPVAYEVEGQKISMRKADASHVEIEEIEGDAQ